MHCAYSIWFVRILHQQFRIFFNQPPVGSRLFRRCFSIFSCYVLALAMPPLLGLFLPRLLGCYPPILSAATSWSSRFSCDNFEDCSIIVYPSYMPCPLYSAFFILLGILCEAHLISIFLSYSLLHSPVFSSCFPPYIPLSILFSKTLNLFSPPAMRTHVSHPYRTAGNIMVSCIGTNFLVLY